MGTLSVFNTVSLDGYFVDRKGEMDWARSSQKDDEWDGFVSGNASSSGGLLVFGRITYEMMASFWPTPAAYQMNPVVAEGMNRLPKLVFSRTLESVSWDNTRLVKDGLGAEIRRLKAEPGQNMVIMGSGSIVSQLAQERLVDEYQIVVAPILLGAGRTLFEGLKDPCPLKLIQARSFPNGNVFLRYAP